MIVLDTNVLSALMSQTESPVIRWLDSQPAQSIWTTTITVYEIEFGLQSLPPGKRRLTLQGAFERAIREDLDNRVLDFNFSAAIEAAEISARLRAIGRPVEVRDIMIAGIATASRATLATRNVKHFADTSVTVMDPWTIGGSA